MDTRSFCLFGYLRSYNDKSKFSFLETVQSSLNTSYWRTRHFSAIGYYRFLVLISLCTLEKISWTNHGRFWKWSLKNTPQSVQNYFLRKWNLNFCITFNMISFVNAQHSIKIILACSKALLLTVSSSNIVIHSNGYIKRDKYFFYKSMCGQCSPETKLFESWVETPYIFIFILYLSQTYYPLFIIYYIYLLYYTNHIYHTKQYETYYRKIKCVLLKFRSVNNGYHRDFHFFMVSILFFH